MPGQARKKHVLDGCIDYIFLQQVIRADVQLSATRQQQDGAPVYCLDGDATKSLRTQCKMVQRCFYCPSLIHIADALSCHKPRRPVLCQCASVRENASCVALLRFGDAASIAGW